MPNNDDDRKSYILSALIVGTAAIGFLGMLHNGNQDVDINDKKLEESNNTYSSDSDSKSNLSSEQKVRFVTEHVVEMVTSEKLRILTLDSNVSLTGDLGQVNDDFELNFDKAIMIDENGFVKVFNVDSWILRSADGNVEVYTNDECIETNLKQLRLVDTSKAEKGAFERLLVSLLEDPVTVWEEKQKESYVSNDKVKVLSMNKKHM